MGSRAIGIPDEDQIEGLPKGAIVKPLGSGIEGLPPGAVVRPIGTLAAKRGGVQKPDVFDEAEKGDVFDQAASQGPWNDYAPKKPANGAGPKLNWSKARPVNDGEMDWSKAKPVGDGPWKDYKSGGAPDTLPGDFFDKQRSAPDTLPGDFFENQLITGKGMEHPNAPIPVPKGMLAAPGERAPGERPNVISRLSETVTGSPHPLDQFMQGDLPSAVASPRQYAKSLLKGEIQAPARLAYSATVHPLDTAEQIMPVNRAIGDARAKNYGAAVGDIGGGLINTVGLGRGIESAPSLARSAASGLNRIGVPSELPDVLPSRDSIARTLRTDTGELKRGVRTGSRVAGAVGGGLTGLIGGHEYGPIGGAIIGGRYAPDLMDAITPNLSDADLMQGRVNRGIRNERIKQAVKAATIEPQPPVYGPTRINDTSGGFMEDPTPVAPYGPTRANPEDLVEPATPVYGPTRINAPGGAETENPIIRTSMPPDRGAQSVGNEGRPATWTNKRVIELAGRGNRDAISQAGRRGLELPENARYVSGDLDYPRAVYNPREVTRFTPEGLPVRLGGKRIIAPPPGPTPRVSTPLTEEQIEEALRPRHRSAAD